MRKIIGKSDRLLLGAAAIAAHIGKPAQFVYDLARRDASFARLVTKKTRGRQRRRYAVNSKALEEWFLS